VQSQGLSLGSRKRFNVAQMDSASKPGLENSEYVGIGGIADALAGSK